MIVDRITHSRDSFEIFQDGLWSPLGFTLIGSRSTRYADPENEVDRMTRGGDITNINFPKWQTGRHLGFDRNVNSAVRSVDTENPMP